MGYGTWLMLVYFKLKFKEVWTINELNINSFDYIIVNSKRCLQKNDVLKREK